MIKRCLTLVAAMAIGIYTASAQTAASAVADVCADAVTAPKAQRPISHIETVFFIKF